MFVTVVAVMCHLAVATSTLAADPDCTAEEARVEEIVTDSSMDDQVDFFSCQLGQAPLAKWKTGHPIYHRGDWRVGRIKCVAGRYERGQA